MSDSVLAAFVIGYAAALAAGSWLADRLPAVSSRFSGPVSPWAREQAVRFRKAMARVVRLVAAFLLLAVVARFRGTAWVWPAALLLVALAGADIRALRRLAPPAARREASSPE